jgi:hypothetical protein
MSYDLVFWRQSTDLKRTPEATYDALVNGQTVDGLVDLPVDDFLAAVIAGFPGAMREPNGSEEWLDWVSANELDSFQVTWSRQHVLVTCRHVHSDDMNRLIDIAAGFGCPLYDPQTSERFQIPE